MFRCLQLWFGPSKWIAAINAATPERLNALPEVTSDDDEEIVLKHPILAVLLFALAFGSAGRGRGAHAGPRDARGPQEAVAQQGASANPGLCAPHLFRSRLIFFQPLARCTDEELKFGEHSGENVPLRSNPQSASKKRTNHLACLDPLPMRVCP
eukprot:s379_g17.t1